jgi:hypothetical protein
MENWIGATLAVSVTLSASVMSRKPVYKYPYIHAASLYVGWKLGDWYRNWSSANDAQLAKNIDAAAKRYPIQH